jgi:tRNA pseudouridine38-40 synthase
LIFGAADLTNYLVRVFYLGTQYYGSQWQLGFKTIQSELMDALSKWSGKRYSQDEVQFSGRTDRGVHSLGQIALISCDAVLNIDRVNKHLPEDIILWASAPALNHFHPRYSILFRHYRYYLEKGNSHLDLTSIKKAAQMLIGSNNYQLLSKPDSGRNTDATILNIYVKESNTHFLVDFYGTRFLWKLVRKIITLFTMIGTGHISLNIVQDLLEKRDVIPSGIEPAPPECLFLMESGVPIKMRKSKYALAKIKKQLENQVKFLDRYSKSLSIMTEDFFSDREIQF